MNLEIDNINKSDIFKIFCLEQSVIVLVLSYLMVLTALFCNLITESEIVLLALSLLSIG